MWGSWRCRTPRIGSGAPFITVLQLQVRPWSHQMAADRKDVWASGDAYEPYVGRWSRLVARQFVAWLGVPANRGWLDVGCGTGALCKVILDRASPQHVTGVDPSDGFV